MVLGIARTTLALVALNLQAQRVFEKDGKAFYQNAQGRQTGLGVGFSPVLTADGKIAMIRGRHVSQDEAVDCRDPAKRNSVVLVDPKIGREKTIFDRGLPVCNFDQMQLSSDKNTLYLVVPTNPASLTLAIINLASGSVKYVPAVESVYVIEIGPHRDELIYIRREIRTSPKRRLPFPAYPLIHARANGEQIAEISTESFTLEGGNLPILAAYLRKLEGTITVNGRKFP